MKLPDLAVSINNLTKIYNDSSDKNSKKALDSVNLNVPRGSFFGLLGPNGAGKSSLINILAGLVKKTTGSVSIWDYDIDQDDRLSRCAIGVVPQELNLDPFFTAREILEVQAGLYGVPKSERKTDDILKAVNLIEKADVYSRTLSGGMRRRLLIAKAMVHSPPILVLDEPTAGVDIELRQTLWGSMKEMNSMGATILLTTHYLEEAEELCDEIAIINNGSIVACEEKDKLIKRFDSKNIIMILSEAISEIPDSIQKFKPTMIKDNRLKITYKPSEGVVGEIISAIQEGGVRILDVVTEEADLNDVFLKLTQDKK
ncbi:MAG: multidrug ABC transporter ATP-binding protein [Alphaproteobacteria bacterium TMED87]|nr:multidrug ABC transporter ATP-binding protein [Rhodospirillaceae bacterium]OUV10733.1 MAG: multidrug ABC transporter ATP-binding protein [Alphaproteobacteria bacterium TMED87]